MGHHIVVANGYYSVRPIDGRKNISTWRTAKLRALKLSTFALLLSCIIQAVAAPQNGLTRQQYEEDFDYLCILDDYAYFDQKQTDSNKVRQIYRPQMSAVQTRLQP